MALDPIKFKQQFLFRAKQLKSGKADKPEETLPPRESFVRSIVRTLGFQPTPTLKSSQTQLSLRAAVQSLGPSTAIALAQLTARALDGPENESGEAYEKKVEPLHAREPAPQAQLDKVWTKITSVTETNFKKPTLLHQKRSGPGHFVGKSLFADVSAFAELPEEAQIFYTAHELAHVENQDSANKQGLHYLISDPQLRHEPGLRKARQPADWNMEDAADARAAEICAKLGCDPKPILKDLMQEPAGEHHPRGLDRAKKVRHIMAQGGQSLSDQEWEQTIQDTAPVRKRREAAAAKHQDMMDAFQDLR